MLKSLANFASPGTWEIESGETRKFDRDRRVTIREIIIGFSPAVTLLHTVEADRLKSKLDVQGWVGELARGYIDAIPPSAVTFA